MLLRRRLPTANQSSTTQALEKKEREMPPLAHRSRMECSEPRGRQLQQPRPSVRRTRRVVGVGLPFSAVLVLSLLLGLVLMGGGPTTVCRAAETIDDVVELLKESDSDSSLRLFPKRTQDEAAVLEWGHSAIITALDAAVARFGPQTAQAALMEVEATPVLAEPINGVKMVDSEEEEGEGEREAAAAAADSEAAATKKPTKRKARQVERPVAAFDNADEVHGNLVVMTNRNRLTGVEMARIAQNSGAAALVVVNVDDEDRPEEIYRLPLDDGHEGITIPTVMISLNSANALTTATVTPEMKPSDIVNNGMPDRVRLYAGGDRPFFEDVEASEPTVYLIHNLLTGPECDALVQQAAPLVAPLEGRDALQLATDAWKKPNVERVMLWQGQLHSPARKAIEDRIEQVTGFPAAHFSDFVVDKYERGSYWLSHYDTAPDGTVPIATITVFLSVPNEGGSPFSGHMVFPSTESGGPLAIRPIKGLAVVHHNANENNEFDVHAVHAQLPPESTLYVATKYIFPAPVSKARRTILPFLAMVNGGRLPRWVSSLHDFMTKKFGYEDGGTYFDKLCIFAPVLVLLSLVQYVVEYVSKHMRQSASTSAAKTGVVGSGGSSDKPPAKAAKDDTATAAKRSKKDKKKL